MAASRAATVRSLASALRLAMRPGGPSLMARLAAVPRMVRATVAGEYPGVSVGRLLMVAAAAGYLVSPVDVIPELLFGPVGLADDAFIVSWLAKELMTDTEDFLEWERARGTSAGSGGSDREQTESVRSHVVR